MKMKVKKFIAIFLSVFMLALCAGMTVTVSATDSSMTILKGTPTVDGVKDDIYNQSASFSITPDDNFYNTGDIDATDNATMWVLYDDKYLYVYIEVKDGDGITPADSAYVSTDPNPWESENAEVWVDESGQGDYAGKFSMEYDGSRFYYTTDNTTIDPSKVIAKAGKLDGGFTVEMAIEMPAAYAPKQGGAVGLTYQVNDHHPDGTTSGMGHQTPSDFIYTYGAAVVAPATTEAPTTVAVATTVPDTTAAVAAAPDTTAAPAVQPAPTTSDNLPFIVAISALGVVSAVIFRSLKKKNMM
ncbi:MAG: hypothetical protein FWD71_01930 [Oscillospiraceae bacterium]|nr:hypothetical protein [Oscillospiraceae bacterium]